MAKALDAPEILNRVFLETRSRLLEVAASLDRLERADGSVAKDPRMKRIHQALKLLEGDQPNKAEQLQMIFSLPYDEQWQTAFSIKRGAMKNGKKG